MKVLQINTVYGSGSTGRIVAGIDKVLVDAGVESYCAFGYGNLEDAHHYRIINNIDSKLHNIQSRIFDSQGLHSTYKTKQFVKWIDNINPDIIHLHNLHGNYLSYNVLFDYLQKKSCKIVWTLHDCWLFTGHCAYFDLVNCTKWKSLCYNCPQLRTYPPALLDRTSRNYQLRKELFTSVKNRLALVPVSNWLASLLKESFFFDANIKTIHNGINLTKFKHYEVIPEKPYILGVAACWDKRKGLVDFIKLRESLDFSIEIKLVGLSKRQISTLPNGITGIERTNNEEELAKLYSGAIAFVNTTYEDNYPTVNLEAIACGTPVITYRTGGSPESILNGCGEVVEQGDIESIVNAICKFRSSLKIDISRIAVSHFNEEECFRSYLKLYKNI